MKEFKINLTDLYSPNNGAPYNQDFSDFFSFKTSNNEVAELGVRLIAECAL